MVLRHFCYKKEDKISSPLTPCHTNSLSGLQCCVVSVQSFYILVGKEEGGTHLGGSRVSRAVDSMVDCFQSPILSYCGVQKVRTYM